MKTAVVLTNDGVEEPFLEGFFDTVVDYSKVRGELEPLKHVLFFGGGTDISPAFYGEPLSRYSQMPNYPRDLREAAAFAEALSKGVACVGICRGAQLITALLGGRLWQHVTGHGMSHKITFWDGRKTVEASSCHHQMMDLTTFQKEEYELLAWSSEHLSKTYVDGYHSTVQAVDKEPEIVYYTNAHALCIQGHPEFCHAEDPFVKECRSLFQEFQLHI
jgi:gamma-glutamyl-gamma-aminobutyrate hydrolase PuuD